MSDIGGMLTGDEILHRMNTGEIYCSDINNRNVNPNSYNLTIGDTLQMLTVNATRAGVECIDLREPLKYTEIKIDDSGTLIFPNELYLAKTIEAVGSNTVIPLITGRSSAGRAGIQVHKEAGFGDLGYMKQWTLQISVTLPTIIYPRMQLAQLYAITPVGSIHTLYHGKYANGESESKINQDFK